MDETFRYYPITQANVQSVAAFGVRSNGVPAGNTFWFDDPTIYRVQPASADTVTLTGAQSLSNKTLVTPTITGPTINPVTAAPNALALTVGTAQVRANSTNVAFGSGAQQALTTGSSNVALGRGAQQSLTTGGNNVAVGSAAQYSLTTGSNNVALGTVAQRSLTTGSNNVAYGCYTRSSR